MFLASAGDTINVKSGDYDVAAGEDFPILVKDGVKVLGVEASTANYPRMGGDVNVADSSVAALFHVAATSADRSGIEIKYLRFVEEIVSGRDAPSALFVQTAGGYTLSESVFHGNIVERLAMNDSGQDDRAAVVMEGGHGTLGFELSN